MVAYTQGVFELLKWFHIVAAITWVGGGIMIQVFAFRVMASTDPARLGAFAKDVEVIGGKFLVAASGTVLLFGIAMVAYSPLYAFRDTWILLALAGYAATFVTGAFFLGPTAGKIAKVMETEGSTAPAIGPMVGRVLAVSRVDLVVLLLVVADMVFKPGCC